jgi:hypothetical protein
MGSDTQCPIFPGSFCDDWPNILWGVGLNPVSATSPLPRLPGFRPVRDHGGQVLLLFCIWQKRNDLLRGGAPRRRHRHGCRVMSHEMGHWVSDPISTPCDDWPKILWGVGLNPVSATSPLPRLPGPGLCEITAAMSCFCSAFGRKEMTFFVVSRPGDGTDIAAG